MEKEQLDARQTETKTDEQPRQNNSDDSERVTGDNPVIKELLQTIKEIKQQQEEFKEKWEKEPGIKHIKEEIKAEPELETMTDVDHINKVYNDLIDRFNKYKNPHPPKDYEQFIYICKKKGIPDKEIARVFKENVM